jgi:tetratricopeptide (TPR) repeat protein
MKFTLKQLAALVLTALLATGIYLLPLKESKKVTETPKPAASGFESNLKALKDVLKEEDKIRITHIENAEGLKNGEIPSLRSLGQVWDSLGHPLISAHYYEEIAKKDPAEKTYLDAAYRYFDAYKLSENTTERAEMVNKAIESYNKVLSFNALNLDASCDLGVLYAEGTTEPMKGIMMLRDVITKNPKHENAQLNLGLLSLKSNQLPKAIDRFKKVIDINPSNEKAWLLLANTQLQSGEKDQAIETFTKFKEQSKNAELKDEIDKYILQIKTDTNLKK